MSSRGPTVSIAIRAFRDRWLAEAIDSVLDGDYEDLELIVYDDRGGLEEITRSRGDERVRYHRAGDDGGPAGRFAAAAALCRGRYLGILDDDDRYEPSFLRRMVAALEADDSAGVAFCKVSYLTPRGTRAPADRRLGGSRPEMAREVMAFRASAPPSTMLVRRRAWESVAAMRPVPAAIAADAYLNVHAAALGWGHVLVDGRLTQRRWHPGQVSQSGLPNSRLIVATWCELGTADPELERIRHDVLARKRITLAVHLLAAGDAEESRREIGMALPTASPGWKAIGCLVALAASVPALGRIPARATVALLALVARRSTPPSS